MKVFNTSKKVVRVSGYLKGGVVAYSFVPGRNNIPDDSLVIKTGNFLRATRDGGLLKIIESAPAATVAPKGKKFKGEVVDAPPVWSEGLED